MQPPKWAFLRDAAEPASPALAVTIEKCGATLPEVEVPAPTVGWTAQLVRTSALGRREGKLVPWELRLPVITPLICSDWHSAVGVGRGIERYHLISSAHQHQHHVHHPSQLSLKKVSLQLKRNTTLAELMSQLDATPHGKRPTPDFPEVYFHAYSFLELRGLSVVPQSQVQNLGRRGCLFVPTRPVLGEFLRKYFLYIHPALPLLNEAEIWSMYYGKPRREAKDGQLSLFVLQCILFASAGVGSLNSTELTARLLMILVFYEQVRTRMGLLSSQRHAAVLLREGRGETNVKMTHE